MSDVPLPERKMAPVQGWPQGIPWSLHLEAYAAYCKKWSPQPALIQGWCRGGFGTKELDEFIPGWRERASEITVLRADNARLHSENLALRETVKRKDQIIVSQGHLIKMYQNKVKQLDGFNGGMGN